MSKTAGFETLGKHPTRLEEPRRLRLAIRIEPTTQAEEVNVFFEVDETKDLDHAQLEPGWVGHSCLLIIYPVGSDVVVDVPRLLRLLDLAGARLFPG
jgi:hypothetical protein